MYEIRSYDQVLHPDLFKGGGVLGLVIRALNFVRWKLEVLIQYLVIRYGLRKESADGHRTKAVCESFWYDVRQESAEFVAKSPLRSFDLPHSVDSSTGGVEVVRADHGPASDMPGRPIDLLISRYGPRGRRLTRRYEAVDVLTDDDSESDTSEDVT